MHTGALAGDPSPDDILGRLCQITEGAARDSDELPATFFENLQRFRQSLERSGKKTVSRQAIRLWQRGTAPSRTQAYDFLQQYLRRSRLQSDHSAQWSTGRHEAFVELDAILSNLITPVGKTERHDGIPNLPALDPLLVAALQGLTLASNNSKESETNSFFRGSALNEERDQSYYLLYRYSTNNGGIIKSFLAVQKPIKSLRNFHMFKHFIWGGEEPIYMSHIFRECEGFILRLQKAFYFLGYNYTVPVDKRRDPDLYRRERIAAKWSLNGIGMIAIEYDDVNASPGLFGGLTMTLAGVAQPIVARIAMLHLGTRQSLGRDLADHNVSLGEIPPHQLSQDLVSTVKQLNKIGCRRFGSVLDNYAIRSEWEEMGADKLATHILRMIDNTPSWELLNSKREGSNEKSEGQGAIETFGEGRPRN